jgi:alpha-amylase/alpha-mannosidase (GH57 family)
MSRGERPPVQLMLLWHMHQPGYGSPRAGRPILPWTRLHATKDYLDMVEAVLERPGLAVTFNLVPSLLEQLAAAAAGIGDPVLDLVRADPASLDEAARGLLETRLSIVPDWARRRFPGLERLARRRESALPLGDDEIVDLSVLHTLSWIDPRFHARPALKPLVRQAEREAGPGAFTRDDRATALGEAHALVGEVIPRYRAIVTRSTRSELSVTPAYHPILPLLCDTDVARRAMPAVPLPTVRFAHPEDAAAQLRAARRAGTNAFGLPPIGLWPSEGSVSPEVVGLAAEAGFRWLASDAEVLLRSRAAGGAAFGPWPHARPWRLGEGGPLLFFRDRELSDKIVFVYARWSAEDAVADVLAHLARLRDGWPGPEPARLLVALDGENCWETYPNDGNDFLARLYDTLLATPWLRTTTPGEVTTDPDIARSVGHLEQLHSGSWIEANFRIWIGHPEKNRAWDAVARTRAMLAQAFPEDAGGPPDVAFWDGAEPVWGEDLGGPAAPLPPTGADALAAEAPAARLERRRQAWRHVLVAEGSDWCWWYGDDHFTGDKATFDRILRDHLSRAWELAGREVPVELRSAFGLARVSEERTAPSGLVSPTINGRLSHFYEWDGAGRWRPAAAGGAMHGGGAGPRVRAILHGFDEERLSVRADLDRGSPETSVALEFVDPAGFHVEVARGGDAPLRSTSPGGGPIVGASAAWEGVCEFAVPFRALGVEPGARIAWIVTVRESGHVVETAPAHTPLSIEVPGPDVRARYWSA